MKKISGQANRIVSLLLLAVMLLTTVPVAVFALGEEYMPIALDEEAQVELNGVDKTETVFSFVPAETGLYSFYSLSDNDTYGYILSAEGDLIGENDDSGYADGNNFSITAELTAGTTYLLKARLYNRTMEGSFTVKVSKTVTATSISFGEDDIFTDRVGAFQSVYCVSTPADTYCGELSWEISNPEMAEIVGVGSNHALAVFKSPGTTTLTLTSSLGFTLTREITVIDAEDIAFDTVTKASNEDYYTCSYRFTPTETNIYAFYNVSNIDTHTIIYLYDEEYMQMSTDYAYPGEDVYISCLLEENVTYFLTVLLEGKNKSVDVCISNKAEPTGIRLDRESYNGYKGEDLQLDVIKNALNESPEEVTWSSDNEAVATVTGGLVSLVGEGSATVTALTESGFSASCAFTVGGYETIKRGETKNVTLSCKCRKSFLFTPEEDGVYSFFSMADDQDVKGYILTLDGDELMSDDDSGDNRNFDARYPMTAGTSYLLKATYLSDYVFGSFDVRVVLTNDDGSIAHSYIDYDYDDAHHTATCEFCGEQLDEEHSFDADGLCVCGFTHVHNGSSFSKDKTHHWGDCPDCQQAVFGEHKYNSENVCIVCGYLLHTCVANENTCDYDDSSHWGICVQCGDPFNAPHALDEDGVCACGYFVHTCISDTWEYNNTHHWGDCTLCGDFFETEHTAAEGEICVCGYLMHECVASEWSIEVNYHSGYCDICKGYIYVDHSYDENGECVCGYTEHDCVVNEWDYDDYAHYGLCVVCGLQVVEEHIYDGDGVCACGYFQHEHVEGGYEYTNAEHCTVCTLCGIQVNYYQHEYDENGVCVCGRERLNGVCIGDTWLSDGDYLTVDGDLVTSKPSVGYAYLYDEILVLHNFAYSGGNTDERISPSLVYTEMDLEIRVEGVNSLLCIDGDCIFVLDGTLDLTGDGSLVVFADGGFDGIDTTYDLTVDVSVLLMYATDNGFEAGGNLTINSGYYYIYAEDDGIDAGGNIVIDDGLFYIDAEDYGIDTSGNVIINGGDFYIVTHDDNGINSDGSLTINGGYFELYTNDECISSVYDVVCINGGTFIFEAGYFDYAVEAVGIVMGDAFTGYTTVDTENGYFVLADRSGGEIGRGTLKADNDDKIQLKNLWVSFFQDCVTALDGKLFISDIPVIDDEDNILVEGEDYIVYLTPAKFEKDGVYCLAVEGIGDYCGTVFTLMTIAPCQGDVNGDGKVSSLDAAFVLRYDADLQELTEQQLAASDVTGDGKVTSLDAAMILRYDADLIEGFNAN